MNLVLSIDLSTSSTGYAVFDRDTKNLISHGKIKPKVPGLHKLKYPKAALLTILDMSQKVSDLINEINPKRIVIEEVNRGINRIGQKSLDACHFFLLAHLSVHKPELLDTITYVDSNGKKGWRGMLGLKLSEQDKQVNAEIRLHNRRKSTKKKAPLIDWKVLAQRYVNVKFKKTFNVWENSGDNDEVDAIAMCDAWLQFLDKV